MASLPLFTNFSLIQRRALLIGVQKPNYFWDDLNELARLAKTVQVFVVQRLSQKRRTSDHKTYLGKGKVFELQALVKKNKIDVVIADDDLNPYQVRNLEKTLQVKVVDRSELILYIFATQARTRQAKLQVELAQMEYGLNRLRRLWTHLERQEGVSGGDLATRGPGEKQIEIDRRLARKRISDLKRKLQEVGRQAQVSRRSRQDLFRVSLVGYTNAGKSTLMKGLTGQLTLVEDKLFSTLDTLTRSLDDAQPPCLVSDTVGFIRKLPRHLLDAFRSTLAEVLEADLLIEVIDAADPNVSRNMKVVHRVLDQIGAGQKPRLTVYNKIDLLGPDHKDWLMHEENPAVFLVSAKNTQGLDSLRQTLLERARGESLPVWVSVPASSGELVSQVLRCVSAEARQGVGGQAKWSKDRLHVKIFLPESEIQRYEKVKNIRIERIKPLRIAKNQSPHYTS